MANRTGTRIIGAPRNSAAAAVNPTFGAKGPTPAPPATVPPSRRGARNPAPAGGQRAPGAARTTWSSPRDGRAEALAPRPLTSGERGTTTRGGRNASHGEMPSVRFPVLPAPRREWGDCRCSPARGRVLGGPDRGGRMRAVGIGAPYAGVPVFRVLRRGMARKTASDHFSPPLPARCQPASASHDGNVPESPPVMVTGKATAPLPAARRRPDDDGVGEPTRAPAARAARHAPGGDHRHGQPRHRSAPHRDRRRRSARSRRDAP